MTSIALSIIIPAYDEEDNLRPVLDDALTTLEQADFTHPFEIVVVDDGSTDQTGSIADDYGRRYPSIRVFHHATNRGLGVALRTGFTNSRGDYVGWISADGQIKADQAVKLLNIADGADFITTTRLGFAAEDRHQGRSFFRGFLTWWMHILCQICVGTYPKHFTGIYMARGPYLRSIRLRSQTGMVGMELYVNSLRRNAKLKNGECEVHPRLSGKSKVATPMGILKSMFDLLKMARI